MSARGRSGVFIVRQKSRINVQERERQSDVTTPPLLRLPRRSNMATSLYGRDVTLGWRFTKDPVWGPRPSRLRTSLILDFAPPLSLNVDFLDTRLLDKRIPFDGTRLKV